MHELIERFLQTGGRHVRGGRSPEKLAEAARDFHTGLAELMSRTVSATDPRGHVEATVRLNREVVRTYISPQAMRDLDARELGDACVRAVAAARLAAAEQLEAEVGDVPESFTGVDPAELVRGGRVWT